MENIFKYLDRIERMNFLILHRATGHQTSSPVS